MAIIDAKAALAKLDSDSDEDFLGRYKVLINCASNSLPRRPPAVSLRCRPR